ncbi:hypothetical protein BKA82DRAFT_1004630 [Pisolithus tinctorius]|nr:hypothetical protein BKA82DRAFT_1004630 [Pisolithus tinctorius]
MSEEHPLVLELTSLRQTAARFQHEAHAAAIRLQRQTLETTHAREYASALEQENEKLRQEAAFLRADSQQVTSHPAERHVQELTLALRRVSEKMDLMDNTLVERTTELTHARSDLTKARLVAEAAHELASRMHAQQEEGKARERTLEMKARASEEERKMVDLVVQEYADLVRSLEGRRHANQSHLNGTPSTDGLHDKKVALQQLMAEFTQETDTLQNTITELRKHTCFLETELDAERQTTMHNRHLLAQAQVELDKLKLDDQTAAKMVTRYMKFSQSSTNALQSQITVLKSRHAATISTLEFQLSQAELLLTSERRHRTRLQDALDELCEDFARESYGRRREIALRLAMMAREETFAESLRRWVRRARESYEWYFHRPHLQNSEPDTLNVNPQAVAHDTDIQQAFHRTVSDAESVLSSLDDQLEFSDGSALSGALARIITAKEAVEALRGELQDEVNRRIEALRRLGSGTGEEEISNHSWVKLSNTPPLGDNEVREAGVEGEGFSLQDSPVPVVRTSKEIANDDPFKVASDHTPLSIPDALKLAESIAQDDQCLVSSSLFAADQLPSPKQAKSPTVSVLELQPVSRTSPANGRNVFRTTPLSRECVDVPLTPTSASNKPTEDPLTASSQHEDPTPLANPLQVPQTLESPIDTYPPPSDTITSLLRSLDEAKHRYDTLQHAFRDCSLALKDLKRTLTSSSPSSSSPFRQTHERLLTALARIDDYTEDARVELEIQIADEQLIAKGFETVLSISGALTDLDERGEMETNARRFVDGTDDAVRKAVERFGRKLEDVQHDIAILKRAVHDVPPFTDTHESTHGAEDNAKGGWGSWTASLLGASPSPSSSNQHAPTFGSVMTSPRLRHTSSLKQLRETLSETKDFLLPGLDFRIPMPRPNHPMPMATHMPNYDGLGLGGPPPSGIVRPRTMSSIFGLGLGARSSSASVTTSVGVRISGIGVSPPASNSKRTTPTMTRFASQSPLSARTASAVTQTGPMLNLRDVRGDRGRDRDLGSEGEGGSPEAGDVLNDQNDVE